MKKITQDQIIQLKNFNTNEPVFPICAASSAYLDDGSNLSEKMANIQTVLNNINNTSGIAYSEQPLINSENPLPPILVEGGNK